MKVLVITLLAILASCSDAFDQKSLQTLEKDLKDFEPLIPKAKIVLLAAKHLFFDSEFRKAKNFIGTPQSNALGVNIMKSRPFRALVDDLNKSGINAVLIINTFAKTLNFPPYPEKFEDEYLIEPRSMGSFINEVINALPKAEFTKLLKQKLRSNPDFKKMYDKLTSAEFKKKIDNIMKYPTLAPTFATFRSNGIDFKQILNAVYTVLDWGK